MKELLMMKGARTLVDVCTKVTPGESVLIVTDMYKLAIGKVIAAVAMDRGAEPVIAVIKPRERNGQEPPEPVAEAMKKADVVFTPVAYSITHTHAVKNAAAEGSRLIVMTDFTEEMMIHGGLEANFEALKPVCKAVAGKFTTGSKLKLTTSAGTYLEMDISGRRGNALYCIVDPGEFSTTPTVEANVSPIEGSANGKLVADASIPYLGIGILRQPVSVEVKNGVITRIDGGLQADILRKDLESHRDQNVFNIAEIGVGLNPKCHMCGIMLEDEGVISTCHIGIGTNITLGGHVKAAIHYDLIMWHPRIEVDGQLVVEGEKVYV
ncbi:MAG: leucyl aminopeptidase [Deltaproteobacteria bacterium]|nr:leucyl aminopeptidase [Deltaproteobacteria bacterium]MBW1963532.1 leucyl aminopeptidase [Deltaproteobacteria bacterium]MBW2152722.1 leucyl aminopeptidase [Deltaproteobacteria bacterium]